MLEFIHTTKQEAHRAIVRTAAALQLGRMLVKQCKEEGILLVNIVMKEEAVEVLKAIGAEFVVNSFLQSFKEDMLAVVKATEATVAFDATGGGTRDGHSDNFRHVSASAVPRSGSPPPTDQRRPALCTSTVAWTSEFLPSEAYQERVQQRSVEQILDVLVPPVAEEIVEVPQERVSECIAEQLVYVPVSRILKETIQAVKPFPQETPERTSECIAELIFCVPVRPNSEVTLEVMKLAPQEPVQQRTVEQIVDVPVTMHVEAAQAQDTHRVRDAPVVLRRQAPINETAQKADDVP